MAESITQRLAEERERHYLAFNAILGITDHNYEGCDMDREAVKTLADAMNYLKRNGRLGSAAKARKLGDHVAAAIIDEIACRKEPES